jgi:MFS family permease
VRRQSLQQVMGGFLGVGISAFIASRTGRAEDFFLPGLIINMAYGLGVLVSILIGHPLIGHLIALLGGPRDWRRRPELRRRFTTATWMWVGVFWIRTIVQVPLYLMGAVATLGAARVVLGLPLYLVAVWLTWRIAKPVMHQHRLEQAQQQSNAEHAESAVEQDGSQTQRRDEDSDEYYG